MKKKVENKKIESTMKKAEEKNPSYLIPKS
jgi:hypothetical protein